MYVYKRISQLGVSVEFVDVDNGCMKNSVRFPAKDK